MLNSRLGSTQVIKLLGMLTLFYLFALGGISLSLHYFPNLQELLPFGGGSALSSEETIMTFTQTMVFSNLSSNYLENGTKLLFAILGVLLVMLPVSWVYMRIRITLDQSLVETMLILPVVV